MKAFKVLIDKKGNKHDVFCSFKKNKGTTMFYLTCGNHSIETEHINKGFEELTELIDKELK